MAEVAGVAVGVGHARLEADAVVTAASGRAATHRVAASDRIAPAIDGMVGDTRAEDDKKREKVK
jgi:hypothetical protein